MGGASSSAGVGAKTAHKWFADHENLYIYIYRAVVKREMRYQSRQSQMSRRLPSKERGLPEHLSSAAGRLPLKQNFNIWGRWILDCQ